MVHVSQQRTLIERLRARRHVNGRVASKEVDWLEGNLELLAGHDWEVFDARNLLWNGQLLKCVEWLRRDEAYVVNAELHEDNEVVVDDVFFAVGPAADSGAAAGLVGVLRSNVSGSRVSLVR